jgi:hypothetical protein
MKQEEQILARKKLLQQQPIFEIQYLSQHLLTLKNKKIHQRIQNLLKTPTQRILKVKRTKNDYFKQIHILSN